MYIKIVTNNIVTRIYKIRLSERHIEREKNIELYVCDY